MNLGTLALLFGGLFAIAYAPEQTQAVALMIIGLGGVLLAKLKGLSLFV